MPAPPTGRLVILTGPSCVGKSPLARALGRIFPELRAKLEPVVLYTSRVPRPGERDGVDFHFRSRAEVEALRADERYAVLDVRGDVQALDVTSLGHLLEEKDALFEGNPFVGRTLQTHPRLAHVRRVSLFLSPLSAAELRYLRDEAHLALPEFVTEVMRRKLLRRMSRQKGELSLRELEEVERRAASAYRELEEAHHFDHVFANHDGEDSENWEAFYYPLADARRALLALVSLLRGEPPNGAEAWPRDLLP
jgi:guanylate kinase